MIRSAAAMVALMVCGVTTAAELHVPSQYSTIQVAVVAAIGGDEILVAPGTYTGTGDWVINPLGTSITIRATGTAEETILDGEGERRVVLCNSGEVGGTVIEGFTITGGYTTNSGGGIRCYSSSPTITGCTISGNTAGYGGGISCYESSPTITDCTISDNTGVNTGGGIYCSSSSPTITDCTISGNTAGYGGGGGIYGYYSSPTITDCTISDNTASGSGGGIYCHWDSNPTLTDTVVCGNDPDQNNGSWIDNGGNTVSDECPTCPDTNSDAVVDSDDVFAVVAAWGSDDPDADVDSDGLVGIFDLLTVLATWGPCE